MSTRNQKGKGGIRRISNNDNQQQQSIGVETRILIIGVAMVAFGLVALYYFTGRGLLWSVFFVLLFMTLWMWQMAKINDWSIISVYQTLKTLKKDSPRRDDSDFFQRLQSDCVSLALFLLKQFRVRVVNTFGEFLDHELNEKPYSSKRRMRKNAGNNNTKTVSFGEDTVFTSDNAISTTTTTTTTTTTLIEPGEGFDGGSDEDNKHLS